jgi:hypothetical protein
LPPQFVQGQLAGVAQPPPPLLDPPQPESKTITAPRTEVQINLRNMMKSFHNICVFVGKSA